MLIKNCWSNKINLIFLIWKRKTIECRISNIFKKEKKKKKKILVKHRNENKVLTIPLEYHVSRRRIRTGNNRKICTPLGLLELEAHLESGVSNRKDTRTACIAFKCLLGNQSKSFSLRNRLEMTTRSRYLIPPFRPPFAIISFSAHTWWRWHKYSIHS